MKPTIHAPERAVITTWTGRHVDLLWPELADIHIDDIAWSLAGINRFNAHTSRLYTVAEHCLLGAELSLPQHKLEFLLHDAPEAYLGDVTGPLKGTAMFAPYRVLEERWWQVMAYRFGVRAKLPKEIHTVDKRMLVTEQRDLMGRPPQSTDTYKPFPLAISPVEPSRPWLAEKFIATFRELVSSTEGAKR